MELSFKLTRARNMRKADRYDFCWLIIVGLTRRYNAIRSVRIIMRTFGTLGSTGSSEARDCFFGRPVKYLNVNAETSLFQDGRLF